MQIKNSADSGRTHLEVLETFGEEKSSILWGIYTFTRLSGLVWILENKNNLRNSDFFLIKKTGRMLYICWMCPYSSHFDFLLHLTAFWKQNKRYISNEVRKEDPICNKTNEQRKRCKDEACRYFEFVSLKWI